MRKIFRGYLEKKVIKFVHNYHYVKVRKGACGGNSSGSMSRSSHHRLIADIVWIKSHRFHWVALPPLSRKPLTKCAVAQYLVVIYEKRTFNCLQVSVDVHEDQVTDKHVGMLSLLCPDTKSPKSPRDPVQCKSKESLIVWVNSRSSIHLT